MLVIWLVAWKRSYRVRFFCVLYTKKLPTQTSRNNIIILTFSMACIGKEFQWFFLGEVADLYLDNFFDLTERLYVPFTMILLTYVLHLKLPFFVGELIIRYVQQV